MNRRRFLTQAGSAGSLALAATAAGCAATPAAPEAAATPVRTLPQGLVTGLTLLTFRVDGVDRLGVKTEKGILDVAAAAAALRMYAPATMDDMLQQEDGPSVKAVVEAHDGTLTVSNAEPGPGAVVRIELPAAPSRSD